MSKSAHAQYDEDPFYISFQGVFSSILSWDDLDAFWLSLRAQAAKGWYIYAIGEPAPDSPRSAEEVERFITEINALLRHDHEEDYCGIVYVDNLAEPGFIKIYDPNNLGVSCGFSDDPPLPGWVLSLVEPKPLEDKLFLPANRRKWWQKIWD